MHTLVIVLTIVAALIVVLWDQRKFREELRANSRQLRANTKEVWAHRQAVIEATAAQQANTAAQAATQQLIVLNLDLLSRSPLETGPNPILKRVK